MHVFLCIFLFSTSKFSCTFLCFQPVKTEGIHTFIILRFTSSTGEYFRFRFRFEFIVITTSATKVVSHPFAHIPMFSISCFQLEVNVEVVVGAHWETRGLFFISRRETRVVINRKFFGCPLCNFSLKHWRDFSEWLVAFCELAPGRSFFIKARRSQVLRFSDTQSTRPRWTLPNQYGCNFLDHPLQQESICLIEISRGDVFSFSFASRLSYDTSGWILALLFSVSPRGFILICRLRSEATPEAWIT